MAEEENITPWAQDEVEEEEEVIEEEEQESSEDIYGKDLMGDAEDRAWLDAMTPLEREQVLADRFSKRKEKLERKKVKQRLKRKKRTSAAAKKTKGRGNAKEDRISAAKRELEDRYQAEEEEEDDDAYLGDSKAARALKENTAGKSSRKMSLKKIEEDEEEHKEPEVVTPELRATLQEVHDIVLMRKTLIKWQTEPFFEEVIKGCFVRVNLGQDSQQNATYRLAVIEKAKTRPRYMVEDKVESTVALILSVAGYEKPFRLSSISNQPVTQKEYDQWLRALAKNSMQPMSSIKAKRLFANQISKARNFEYKEEEVEKLVQQRTSDANWNKLPVNVLRQKSTELKARLRVAHDENDKPTILELKEKLEQLGEIIAEKSAKLEQDVSKVGSTFNERVRESMFKTSGAHEYYKDSGTDATGQAVSNPFVRRKTVQHMMHVGEEADRVKEREAEERRKREEEEKAREEEKRKRQERIAQNALLSDMHALKRKKTMEPDEESIRGGLHGVQSKLEAAHNFELDLDL